MTKFDLPFTRHQLRELIALLIGCVLSAPSSYASTYTSTDAKTPPPVDQIIHQVQQQTKAKVIAVSPGRHGQFHTVRLLTRSGQVKLIRYNNSSGAITELEQKAGANAQTSQPE